MNKKTRIQVWNKYMGHCAYCGAVLPYDKMQVDHLFPQRLKWALKLPKYRLKYRIPEEMDTIDHIDNLMPSCARCNHYKRSMLLEGFRKLMKTLHLRIEKDYICRVALDYLIITVTPWDGKFYFEKYMKRTKKSKKDLYNIANQKQAVL
jgi:hypothetical protein